MKTFFKSLTEGKSLIKIEFFILCLFIVTLPILEAPKNIFLVSFLIIAIFNQFQIKNNQPWGSWDNIFLFYIISSFLSAMFAGIPLHDEWRGFRTVLFTTLFCWVLYRATYKKNQIIFFLFLAITSALIAQFYAYYELIISHARKYLELHSVGHVNHSAIYLTIIASTSVGMYLTALKNNGNISKYYSLLVAFISLISIVNEGSRIATFAFFLTTIILITLIPNKIKIKIFALLISAFVLCAIYLFNGNVIKKMVGYYNYDQQNTNYKGYEKLLGERSKIWNTSFEAAQFSPMLGIGEKNWVYITLPMIKNQRESKGLVFDPDEYHFGGHSHNLYLNILVERGVLGLLALLAFMFLWLKQIICTYKFVKINDWYAPVWTASFASWIVIFLCGLFNTSFQHENALLSTFFLSLHLMVTKIKKN